MNLDQRVRALAGNGVFSPEQALELEAEGFTLSEIARALIPLVESDEEYPSWWDLFDFECLVADRRGLETARALVNAVRPGSEAAFVTAYARRRVFAAVDSSSDYTALTGLAAELGVALDPAPLVGWMLQRRPLVAVLRDPHIPSIVLRLEVHRRLRLADVLDELLATSQPIELAGFLTRFFDEPPAEVCDEAASLRTIGRAWRALGRTAWAYADLLTSWVPALTPVERATLLRDLDMSASHWILRRTDEGETLAGVALEASEAGFGDEEILHGFRENALGTDHSLRVLASVGWDVARLVRSQLADGISPAEVREQLRTLGAAPASVRAALLVHIDAEVLRLVLGGDEAARLAPARAD